MSTWSAVITRTTSGTIEVEVEAGSEAEASEKIKENLRNGAYDQRLMDAIAFNAECEEDQVHDLQEEEDNG